MKNVLLLSFFLLFQILSLPKTIIVDANGGGLFTKISDALTQGGLNSNDTVKVWPGFYDEPITLNKNIILVGSGYENTTIGGNYNPTITMSTGKLLWFKISSIGGSGINLSGGLVTNCLIISHGIGIVNNTNGASATVMNCICWTNTNEGINAYNGGIINVTNAISRSNGGYGFRGSGGTLNLSYSNGSQLNTNGNTGCLDVDPLFTSVALLDFHISQGSPCWDTGNPAYNDPDGSRSDMGYFGGPDCPLSPSVYQITITPNGSNINLNAKARADY